MVKRRFQRLSWFQRNKKYVYLGVGAVCLGVFSFSMTLFVAKNNNGDLPLNESPININEYAYKTDESSIRINPESLKKSEIEVETKIEREPQEAIVKEAENEKEEIIVSSQIEEDIVETSIIPVKKEKISFIKPLDGEIVLEYAKDKLVYSKTLEEWITHNGVDIKGEEAMPVKASADGIIKDKKVDPRYGNTIIIEHDDGYKTVYSNLSTLDLVEVGQEVKQGEIISGVGRGYGFESEEGEHIHYEIWENDLAVNPLII